ncbi:MAG: hypothetical protein ACLU9S_05485 [Oscillospiraceae bacterium]
MVSVCLQRYPALVSRGDTTLYHGGLVVLPEYGLSCAVLSPAG